MPKRRTIIIGGIVLVVVAGIGAGIWWYLQNTEPGERFFSFGTPRDQIQEPTQSNGTDTTQGTSTPQQSRPPVLYQLHQKPVAGITAFDTLVAGTSTTAARFVERDVGHVYEMIFPARTKSRISNETVQGVQHAEWGGDGDMVALQTLIESDVISTYALTFPENPGAATSSGDTQEGIFLPDYIHSLTAEGGNSARLFALRTQNDRAAGSLVNFTNANSQEVFSSPLSEWNARWIDGSTISLLTKPSYLTEGQLYHLSPSGGNPEFVLGGHKGLTTLTQPNGPRVLYAYTENDQISLLRVWNTDTRSEVVIPVVTLPEKCVWGLVNTEILYCVVPDTIPRGQYPDIWYQGRVSFGDTLHRIDLGTNQAEQLVQLADQGELMDATELVLGPREEYLFFINKVDGTPWRVYLDN